MTARDLPDGLYRDISYQDYDAIQRLRCSDLKRIETSPAAFRAHAELDGTIEFDTPALALGRATHMAVFEPDRFASDVQLFVGMRRGKAWEQFVQDHAGQTVLTEQEHERCRRIAAAVRGHKVAVELLADGWPETTALWSVDGTPAKARLDWLDGQRGLIADLKTCADPGPREFSRSCVRYLYHAQMAWYADAALACGATTLRRVSLIAAQSLEPYDVVVYDVPTPVLALGRRIYQRWLATYRACLDRQAWPGIAPDAAITLELPEWAWDSAPGADPEWSTVGGA